jgi:hypothetical protein
MTASIPNPFTAGTDAVAAEVNANFESLRDYINNNVVWTSGERPITGTQTISSLVVSNTLTVNGNLNVDADITGQIVASNGTSIVLDNGTNGSDATFKGDIQNASGTTIVDVSAATFAGNASTATKLAATKNIDVTGVTATAAAFDGSANVEIEVTAVPSSLLTGTIDAGTIDAGTFGAGAYTFPGALTVNGLLDVSSQAKIEFGNENDQIRFDDDDDEFSFWIDGNKHFQIGGVISPNDVVTKATGTFKSNDSGSQFPTGSGTAAHIITGFGLSALVKNSSVAADKENVSADLGSYLTADMIDSVVPKMWNRITAPGYPEIGPIADDMETVSEFLASHGTDENGDQILMGVDQTAWMSLMTLAIQDIRTRLAAVEAA